MLWFLLWLWLVYNSRHTIHTRKHHFSACALYIAGRLLTTLTRVTHTDWNYPLTTSLENLSQCLKGVGGWAINYPGYVGGLGRGGPPPHAETAESELWGRKEWPVVKLILCQHGGRSRLQAFNGDCLRSALDLDGVGLVAPAEVPVWTDIRRLEGSPEGTVP